MNQNFYCPVRCWFIKKVNELRSVRCIKYYMENIFTNANQRKRLREIVFVKTIILH